jgi:hypothetical protein
MGIRDRPITPRSPWQNGHVERLIGSIRRECLDHVVVLGEWHLRHLLANYATYYNGVRTHLALDKDTPLHRPAQRVGRISELCVADHGNDPAILTRYPDLSVYTRGTDARTPHQKG